VLRIEVKKNLFKEAPQKLRRALYGVAQRTAEAIAERAREYVLMYGLVDTGWLYASIVSQAVQGRVYNYAEVVVGAYYGMFIEFGTRFREAKPFLTPAAEEKRNEFNEEIAKAVRRVFEAGGIAISGVANDYANVSANTDAAYFGGDAISNYGSRNPGRE
jgi:HK97 gp10 family phage protein